jgi:disulfide bond formation protein DsbB
VTNLVGFLACAALLAYALYAQLVLGLSPCPLCWLQRGGVALLGLVFLIAALDDPRGWGTRITYTLLIALSALLTAGLAAQHLYVQHMPPGLLPSCGAPIEVMYRIMPFMKFLQWILTHSGECHEVNWTFLFLSMPAWVLICVAALGIFGVVGNLRGGSLIRQAA